MSSRFRQALMWLLLLALPVQGLAAATMLHCGAGHQRGASSLAGKAGSAHRHAASGAHHHAAAAVVTAAVAHDAAQPDLTKSKCSACAACCIGAALPATALVFESFAPALAPLAFVSEPAIGFVTDGPDRPPRILPR
jgi:hypothetical protein